MIEETSRAIERLIVVASAPVLLLIGYRLFLMGATGVIKIDASLSNWKGKISNLSPGTFCFALAVAIGIYALDSKLTSTVTTTTTTTPEGISTLVEQSEFLSGSGQRFMIPESVVIRARLGNVMMCTNDGGDQQKCMVSEFFKYYKRAVESQTLKKIESLENAAAQGESAAQAELRELLKGLRA